MKEGDVQCIAYIINLAVQIALKTLKACQLRTGWLIVVRRMLLAFQGTYCVAHLWRVVWRSYPAISTCLEIGEHRG